MQFSFETKNWDKDLHLYTYKELNILLDINSGAVHLVDDLTKDVINSLKQHNGDTLQVLARLKGTYSEAEIVEVLAELKSLEDEGLLFTQEEITAPWTAAEKMIKSLCLHVAHDCNLRCRYCFAGTGEFNGPRGLMELEVGKAALDFLLANSGSRPTVEVDF